MSQDLVRQYPQRPSAQLPTPAEDVWMQQQAMTVTGGSAGGEVQPLKIVHRSLRGRYKIAILLAAVGAAAGALFGWTTNEQNFRAAGLIRIMPETPVVDPDQKSSVISNYNLYMVSEASVIRSQDIAKEAIKLPEFTQVAGSNWNQAAFMSRVRAQYAGGSQHITVTFDNPDPKIAVAGMNAAITAYKAKRTQDMNLMSTESMNYLQKQRQTIVDKIFEIQNQITAVRRASDKGSIDKRAELKGTGLAELERRLDSEKRLLAQMLAQKERALKNPPPVDIKLLAPSDTLLTRLVQERDAQIALVSRLTATSGARNPNVLREQATLDKMIDTIESYARDLSKGLYGTVTRLDMNSEPILVNEASIAMKQDDVDTLTQNVKDAEKEVAAVDDARFTVTDLQIQLDARKDELKGVDDQIVRATARSQTVMAPFYTSPDLNATKQEDKRPTMATLGFVVGGGLPVMGLVLLGLLDRRYRYSDEATSGGTRGVPLLGILPNLPDRLSDPSQASVAAHCVHQIRTMLQLNTLADGPSVLGVTSATSGDGKTSLCLALGLSFAASGSRTLLIDTDLIGAGLSARLGIREPVGISEAIVARNPMDYVRETDVTDLSVLPVGAQGAQNASAFSPSAVRKLVAEVRKHFDIILIDTGPVLGSIEATPVVAATDAVILTVARGQNRDLVEKAIEHLRKIGSRIAGVVFNRANARDFERSISGISLRSVSRASASAASANGHSTSNLHQDKRLGPLVQSVRGGTDD